jgi:hypothetical protein
MEFTQEQINELVEAQCKITAMQTANFCSLICDVNRGHLSIGDVIRKQFNVEGMIQKVQEEAKNPNVVTLKLVKGGTLSTEEKQKSIAKLTVVKRSSN